jgi:hypothetical protein
MKIETMKRIVEASDAIDRFGQEGMYHANKILKEIIAGEESRCSSNRRLCGEVFTKRGRKPPTSRRSVKKSVKTGKA